MRLGAYKALIRPGTLAHKLYGTDSVTERHRHQMCIRDRHPAHEQRQQNH